MSNTFLLYGANGFVGQAVARHAITENLKPILAGRNTAAIQKLANELDLEYRVFSLSDIASMDRALADVQVVLHCAGPYIYTSGPMVESCIRTGTHYLDITGELPVYEYIALKDEEAKLKEVMILPGIGFDVVPTDCLALHLKNRLPTANKLVLAFHAVGPAGLPPGTQKTMIELVPYGDRIRVNGSLGIPERKITTREIDFGNGPVRATRFTWGDVFTAYYSTGIPNIEDYLVLSESVVRQLSQINKIRPLFKLSFFRNLMMRGIKPGPTEEECSNSLTHVWGEVTDKHNNRAVSRIHGPEAGVIWTKRAAIAGIKKILSGISAPGFQTPAMAFGADFVLECEGVSREDIEI
jgi:short subunit dehydrogenase-like uncharacterized protein